MPSSAPAASSRRRPSLFFSVKEYLATWVEVFRVRMELFSTEWQEEWQRLEEILLLAAAMVLCLGFGLLLVTFLVVVAFWDTPYRLAVLGGFAFLYLAVGTIAGLTMRRKSRHKPKLFSATLGELAKDYRRLSP